MYQHRLGFSVGLAAIAPLAVTAALAPVRDQVENTHVALLLVVVVVGVAAYGQRLAGYLAALSAGIWFNFFFTEPYHRLWISDRSDVQTFVLLMVVGAAAYISEIFIRRADRGGLDLPAC